MAAIDEQDYTKSFDWKIWKRLFPIFRTYRVAFVMLLVFNALTALVDVGLPLLQRYAIANFIEKDTLTGIVPYALVYLVVILLQALSVVLFARNSMSIEMNAGRDLRRTLFTHLQTLSFSFYNVTPVGYLLSRVMSDTNRIASMIAWNLTDILWAMFYVFGTFAAMLILNWRLALVVILIVPVIAVLTWYFQNRILHWNRKVRKLNSKITGAFNEGITGAKTSKTLVIEDQNTASFRELTESMRVAGVRAARLNAVYIPLVLFCSTMAVAIVLLRGGHMVLDQVLEIATLSTFTTYAVGIFEPIQMTAANIAEFISLQASIERVTGLMDEVPQVQDTPEVLEKYGDVFSPKRENWEPLKGDIEFRDVTFRYPDGGENVLEHFSLKIPAGTTVAIVGETGAGKSTLVNLACRFFEPTAGQILIDGRDYRERSQLWLHENIGYVLQSPHLFSGSVRENIRYGRLDATDAEVEAAAKAVSADTVVAKLEHGWDSQVGEGGDKLSTGEKQLISFARAVLADPRIFVLDEATSSIDTQTEQLIQNAIDHLLQDRTSFLIAHRLSTIRKADLILVVRDGKIVEQGTHQELLRQHGYYHDLYSKQFAEENAAKILK
ncbi:MAG TPA: ABC transporter ATP-binding protein [Candidatus Avoscillospira stercorigallinarum]|uniref:ABC transporter ATP-binding protein n=1 Tax=Candidatus Avoscillospira stercorigallinarum TaxID=2840708 RepID=A0A9D1CPW6_9FIRM|nr:ABC transporter ATP-binding protein [Candidatus Avoscillospira stercorigallinarum]